MTDKNQPPKTVIAPMHKMTRIKERLDRNGNVITRQVEEPKK